ncbi:MAG: proline--tRNA ligase [Verrucomicrobiota bacterium]
MKLSTLVGQRLKETPRDAQTASHTFLIRGGYVRPVSAGIYSLLPLAKRITAKIEGIVREEMDGVGGQEVLMPVVLPQELWDESGRSASVGPELVRFQNRNETPMVLGMTHEEAVVHLIRTEVNSYKQLPVMVYQIQTKYRDEARPRAGLIRVREFTMKDAYSFHCSQEDLAEYYRRVHDAYERIFRRVGMRDVLSIQSDTGMMGGAMAHEFMAVAECGEDVLFTSPDGSYRANREVASAALEYDAGDPLPLEEVHTPGTKTIQELADFLGVAPARTCKVVFYEDGEGGVIVAALRGDLDVNESKLRKVLQTAEFAPATDERIRAIGAEPGYASLMDLDGENCRVVVDPSVAKSANLVVGANKPDYHVKNFNVGRDATCGEAAVIADIATAREGDPCPLTGEPLQMKRGIEIGNIFQLGTKYTEAMGCNYLDENGKAHPMIMGCYGIGVGRTMASVIEQSHDEYGPIWPMSIAPYQVHICALNAKKPEVAESADRLYRELTDAGIEVLYDDRGEKAGFMFSDADLIGVPLRLVVSPKTVAAEKVEFKTRDGDEKAMLPTAEVVPEMRRRIDEALNRKAE